MDKRIVPRRIKRLSITFSDGKVERTGTSSDFSETGLFIRTRKPFNPGTNVNIVIEITAGKQIRLEGIVVRAIKTGAMDFKNGMGIKLTTIPEEYKNFVKGLG
jgi:Tfp pilus assembly protein PilZ